MSDYRMQYGSDEFVVTLGQPEKPILVDGEDIGRQNADGSCRVADCIRIAARHCWGPNVDWNEVAYYRVEPEVTP
jgi:hypothetical protein